MPTPKESADLLLRLYELRREPVMRQARAWFITEFNPTSFEEIGRAVSGEKSAWLSMVVSYWDMAASLVTFGAIDREMFIAFSAEMLTVFAKVEPFLDQMRPADAPEFLKHLEQVARQFPNAETRLPQTREYFRTVAERQPDGAFRRCARGPDSLETQLTSNAEAPRRRVLKKQDLAKRTFWDRVSDVHQVEEIMSYV